MVCILINPRFRNTFWCRQITSKLKDELKRNRINYTADPECDPRPDAAFVITSDYAWTRQVLKRLAGIGIPAILISTFTEKIEDFSYNSVSFDLRDMINSFYSKLNLNDSVNLALYGINTNSAADVSKTDYIFSLKNENIKRIRLYVNQNSLEDCFESFISDIGDTDVILCVNKFVAISLIHRLKKDGIDPDGCNIFVLDTPSALESYNCHVTTVSTNYESLATAAMLIYKTLRSAEKHGYAPMTVAISVKGDLQEDKNRAEAPPTDEFYVDNDFEQNTEMKDIMTLDSMVNDCSDEDKIILKRYISGISIKNIADEIFITEAGIRYRLNRLQERFGFADRKSLKRLVDEYLDGEF